MKEFRSRAVLLLFGLFTVFAWPHSEAFAKEKKQKCKNYVHYDARNGNLKFSGFGVAELSVGTDSKVLNVASDLTQIFDLYQVTTCERLNQLGEASEHEEDVRNSLETTARLAGLMAVLSKGKLSDDDDILKLIDSVPKAKELKAKLPSEKTKDIQLAAHLEAANPEFEDVLRRLKPVARACAWDLVSEPTRNAVERELIAAAGSLAQPLDIPVDQLRAYVFMPCADGRLYVAAETRGVKTQSEPGTIRILPHYGFVGVAYEEKKKQIDVIPGKGEEIRFHMANETEENNMRRILIEPLQKEKSTARWIIAVPLMNRDDQPIGVLSVSSDTESKKNQLDIAYDKSKIDLIVKSIASLLVKNASKGSMETKN